MGKIRVKTLGDESIEREQKLDAKARREEKKAKKAHVKGVGLKGGQQVQVMEGVELTEEAKEAVAAVESGETEKETKKQTQSASRKIKARSRSKRYQALRSAIDITKVYPLKEAIKLIKKTSNTKFIGSVESHINLNLATLAKDKKTLSGSVVFPHGTGKTRKIAIVDDALLDEIGNGKINFDVLVAHPSMMPKLAKHAKFLGPRGLMPNPKNGTVSPDPEKRVKELSGGEVSWKTEPDQPVIHQVVGKVNFTDEQLLENIQMFTKSIGTGKIAKLTLSSSMGPGIKVDVASLA